MLALSCDLFFKKCHMNCKGWQIRSHCSKEAWKILLHLKSYELRKFQPFTFMLQDVLHQQDPKERVCFARSFETWYLSQGLF